MNSDKYPRTYNHLLRLKLESATKNLEATCIPSAKGIDCFVVRDWVFPPKERVATTARSLFMIENEIVARGYDKMKKITRPTEFPMTVSVKENGSVILISGLSSGRILVCSRTRTCYDTTITRNHAARALHHLENQMRLEGTTTTKLAEFLYERNLTAMAELCDDFFQEHIFSYPVGDIILHGLNYNTSDFHTLPMEDVNLFAELWGFEVVHHFTVNGLAEYQDFYGPMRHKGPYRGKEIEGFVIRVNLGLYKLDALYPYPLYHQLREVTRQIIWCNPRFYVAPPDLTCFVRDYAKFARKRLLEEPSLQQKYLDGHGVIRLREEFLRLLPKSTPPGQAETVDEKSRNAFIHLMMRGVDMKDQRSLEDKMGNITRVVFVPISILACGKTTVFRSLLNLFSSWKLNQNDVMRCKPERYARACADALQSTQVLMAERNNPQIKDRQEFIRGVLRNASWKRGTKILFVALDFTGKQKIDRLEGLCLKRARSRLRFKASSEPIRALNLAKKVLHDMVKRFQPLSAFRDVGFDGFVVLPVTREPKTVVLCIVDWLKKHVPDVLPFEPSMEQIAQACEDAFNTERKG